jgi:hypothetical protein
MSQTSLQTQNELELLKLIEPKKMKEEEEPKLKHVKLWLSLAYW